MSCYSTTGSHHKDDGFVVPTSPTNVSTPLGHSEIHDHFIKPVPGFETEYESAYCHADSDIDKTTRSKPTCQYNELKCILKKMILAKFEVELANNLLDKAQQSEKKSLLEIREIDEMYRHIQDLKQCQHLDVELRCLITDFMAFVDALKNEKTC